MRRRFCSLSLVLTGKRRKQSEIRIHRLKMARVRRGNVRHQTAMRAWWAEG